MLLNFFPFKGRMECVGTKRLYAKKKSACLYVLFHKAKHIHL